MKTVVLSIRTLDTALSDFATSWEESKADEAARIGFESWDLMHKVLSPKRLEIIRAMVGADPLSIREIARRVGRDFKGVHSDVTLLFNAGVVERGKDGRMSFPYDRIHVDFELSAAA